MKRCPQCGREYDNTMSFCLDDGAELLYGPALSEPGAVATGFMSSDNEPATVIFSEPLAPGRGQISESATRPQIHTAAAEAESRGSLGNSTERQSLSAHQATKPKRLDKRLLIAPIALAVIVLGGFFGYRYLTPGSRQINSIAVLPFENRSGNADTDYLSDGLTDSLIFRFSQLPNLKVSPTSSVMRYKGKVTEVAEVAKDLEVDAVLSGRLMQLGDSLNISVQLIDARTKKLVWAEQYDRKMADLLATQREIATTLTQKMQLRLAGDERGITKKYTNNSEAYQLYLKGRYHWSKRTKDDLFKAVDSFKQAIGLDPNFALSYVGMAEAYNSMAKDPDVAPKDAVPFAKSAASRAIEIDPSLAEAHSALGDALAIYDWNWAESERELKKAIDLDPNISYIHLVYSGSYLGPVGRLDEAVREAERAVELEPASLINNAVLASSFFYARQYDKAIAQARRTYELDPNFPLSRYWLGMAYVAKGDYDQAISISREARPDLPSRWFSVAVLAHAYAKTGKRTEAELQIAELRELGKTRYIRPYYIASIYAALGEKDSAFAELDRSFEERDVYLSRANSDPFMDPLRDDPRFKDLIKRMNLTPNL